MKKILETYKDFNGHPGVITFREDYGDSMPPVCGVYMSYYPTLMISDPDIVNELYVTKNKFFDKHKMGQDMFFPLMGESILLSKSTEDWAKKRKVLS